MDYPDTDDTDDTETYKDYKSLTGRRMVETGVVDPIWYDIKEGKKVYYDWAGINQPMEDIWCYLYYIFSPKSYQKKKNKRKISDITIHLYLKQRFKQK